VDVACAIGSAPCLTAADTMGYEIDEAEVAYWGRCADCLAEAASSSATERPPRRHRNRPKSERQQQTE
jgi:Fur family ferric uptake transcriptional regulator